MRQPSHAPHARSEPGQPRRLSTVATAPAVSQRRSPRSSSAEPERHEASYRVGIIAALIAPLLVSRVRGGPVELDAHPDTPRRGCRGNYFPCPGLSAPAGERQAARADVPRGARSGIPAPTRHHLLHRRARRQSLDASASSCGRPWRGGSALRSCACGRWPVISTRTRRRRSARNLDQVEHGILHPGTWREHAGCLVCRIASDLWITRPGIFARRPGCLAAGTVIVITGLGPSVRPWRSAAVWWLSTASGPARSRAAHSIVSRPGSPEKAA